MYNCIEVIDKIRAASNDPEALRYGLIFKEDFRARRRAHVIGGKTFDVLTVARLAVSKSDRIAALKPKRAAHDSNFIKFS